MQPEPNELKKNSGNIDCGGEIEARQNIAGFFKLLFDIDKRLNPQLYQQTPSPELNQNNYEHNRSPDNTN